MTNLDFHEMLDELDPGPVPMEEISSRAGRIRRGRIGAILGSAAAVAVIAFAVVPHGASPASRASAPFSRPGGPVLLGPELAAPTITNGVPSGPGNVAAGRVGKTPWRIGVTATQVPGMGCLPAVTLDGTAPDILFPRPDLAATPAGALSLVSAVPGLEGASFAVFRVPASVTWLTVGGLRLTPVTRTACGQRVTLAAVAFDTATGTTITAPHASYRLPAGLPGVGSWETLGNGSLPASQLRRLADGPGWSISVQVHDRVYCAQFDVTPAPLGLQPAPVCQDSSVILTAMRGNRLLYGYVIQADGSSFVTVNPVTGASRSLRVTAVDGLRLVAYAGTSPVSSMNTGNSVFVFSK